MVMKGYGGYRGLKAKTGECDLKIFFYYFFGGLFWGI